MGALNRTGAKFTGLLAVCGVFYLGLGAGPAMAGCNSGNVANTALLSDANCQAAATGLNATAIGRNAEASGVGAIAIGGTTNAAARPIASGDETTAIGADAQASGLRGMAFGNESRASGAESIAMRGVAAATNSIAIGDGSSVQAAATNAVALGSGSVATQANTVSVGSAGNERRITNVAPGVDGTDAVNVDQLNAVAVGGAAPIVEQLAGRMGSLESRLDEVTSNSYRGIAGVAAMAVAMPTAPGRTAVNMGVGYYEGYSAVGGSVTYLSASGRYNVSGGLSYSGGKSVGRIGVGFQF